MHTDLTDHTDFLHGIFEHEIRRRPTDRREVIKRIKLREIREIRVQNKIFGLFGLFVFKKNLDMWFIV